MKGFHMESLETVVTVFARRIAELTDDWRWAREETERVNEIWRVARRLDIEQALEDELYHREGGPE